MELINATQLAQALGVSKRTIYHWGKIKGLPKIKFSRRCVRYDLGCVMTWAGTRGCFIGGDTGSEMTTE